MTTQALSIAISNSGLARLFNALVVSGQAFAANLDAWTPPDTTIGPMGFEATNIGDYVLSLTGGSASNASGTLTSAVQVAAGSSQFSLSFDIDITVTYQHWTESYTLTTRGYPHHYGPYDCGAFTFTATGITLTAIVSITQVAGAWVFSFVSASADASKASIPIVYPANSLFMSSVYSNIGACGGQTIADQLEPELAAIDFTSAVQTAIQPILSSITESGQLTPAIGFAWTPNTFVFPDATIGLQAGVTGLASYKGSAYSSSVTPPDLGLPDIPPSNDVQIFAADYLFNSLYWAYFQANALTQTITANMIGSQKNLLNTTEYQSSIPALFRQYPNAPMQVVITQASAPTIAFVSGYELPPPYMLTPPALSAIAALISKSDYVALEESIVDEPFNDVADYVSALQTALGADYGTAGSSALTAGTTPTAALSASLPSAVFTALMGMTNTPFLSQADFETALVSFLGSKSAQQYQAQIEAIAGTTFATFVHQPTCLYQVMNDGALVDVFTIQITETDVLTYFQLGVSGTAQTLQCQYQIPAGSGTLGAPTATLVSSEVGSVNAGNFASLWQFVLAAQYATIVQAVASIGVPLPYIEGYTFQNSTVSMQPGYLDVSANVVFNS